MKGFALILSLVLVILLTVAGLAILTSTQHHYSAIRSLFENQNARIACDSALQQLIDKNNYDLATPKFMFRGENWNNLELNPTEWNGYKISGHLDEPWDPISKNWFQLSAQKGMYVAKLMLHLRQLRLEDFALFTDQEQEIDTPSLIEGMTIARPVIRLMSPGTRFRDHVFCDVSPLEYGSYRKASRKRWAFPVLTDLISTDFLRTDAQQNGLLIQGRNPVFWKDDSYQLNLDLLQIQKGKRGWKINYAGTDLGSVQNLHLNFDSEVKIQQSDRKLSPGISEISDPLYISSQSSITIESSLAPILEDNMEHPMCLIAGSTIAIRPASKDSRISAALIALGSEDRNGTSVSLFIEEGQALLSSQQKEAYLQEIHESTFLLEQEKIESFVRAVNADQPAIWFRGTIALTSTFKSSDAIFQLHFEKSGTTFPLLPSLPFLIVVDGSRQWL